jgi:hypothetical protein
MARINHVVLFGWTPEATPAQKQACAEALAGLKAVIPGIIAYSSGDQNSPEAPGQGIDFGSPDLAVGLGIRLDLPVGPIRFEYGHNLTRDGSEPSGTWHFAIGTAF